MKYPSHSSRPGGSDRGNFRPKFGQNKPWERGSNDRGGDRGFDRPTMHQAICSECNARCEVPFKPNGKKPIFCSNCFKRDERPDFDRKPSHDSFKPSYTPESRPSNNSNRDLEDLKGQMKAMNFKLDAIIKTLSEIIVEDEDMEDEEDEFEALPEAVEEVISPKKVAKEKAAKKKK